MEKKKNKKSELVNFSGDTSEEEVKKNRNVSQLAPARNNETIPVINKKHSI